MITDLIITECVEYIYGFSLDHWPVLLFVLFSFLGKRAGDEEGSTDDYLVVMAANLDLDLDLDVEYADADADTDVACVEVGGWLEDDGFWDD